MPARTTFDVMISHSTAEKATSNMVCERLERAGIRCWIAPRNIAAGTEWTAAILDGINSSRVMVLVFSESANASRHVQREILYATENKLPILPFRIQHTAPTGSLAYCLLGVQWLDAWATPAEQHVDALISRVQSMLADLPAPATHDAPAGDPDAKVAGAAQTVETDDIYFDCTQCGRAMVIDAAASGMAVECLFCGKEVIVPGTLAEEEIALDPATLAQIAERLSHTLGPIARHLVKTNAGRSSTLHDLCQRLADHIHDKQERASFLDSMSHHARCVYPPPPAKRTEGAAATAAQSEQAPASWPPEVLKRIKTELAGYLGPVAGVLVERAAKEVASPRELYERLAANISLPKEREKWLHSGKVFRL